MLQKILNVYICMMENGDILRTGVKRLSSLVQKELKLDTVKQQTPERNLKQCEQYGNLLPLSFFSLALKLQATDCCIASLGAGPIHWSGKDRAPAKYCPRLPSLRVRAKRGCCQKVNTYLRVEQAVSGANYTWCYCGDLTDTLSSPLHCGLQILITASASQ